MCDCSSCRQRLWIHRSLGTWWKGCWEQANIQCNVCLSLPWFSGLLNSCRLSFFLFSKILTLNGLTTVEYYCSWIHFQVIVNVRAFVCNEKFTSRIVDVRGSPNRFFVRGLTLSLSVCCCLQLQPNDACRYLFVLVYLHVCFMEFGPLTPCTMLRFHFRLEWAGPASSLMMVCTMYRDKKGT